MASFSSVLLESLLDFLNSPDVVGHYSSTLRSDPAGIRRLHRSVLAIKAFIDDAEERASESSEVKTWLEDVTDALCDVEDVLDEIAFDAMWLKFEADQSDSSSTSTPSSQCMPTFLSKVNLMHEVERIDLLAKQTEKLGVMEKSDRWCELAEDKPSERLDKDKPFFCGRDKDIMEICRLVLSEDDAITRNDISVVSIVGKAGVGTTTLAQRVYDHEEVQSSFELKAWVFGGKDFDVGRLTKEIVEQVIGESCEMIRELNQLQIKLQERLLEKKFLLILDDVWSEDPEQWLLLRSPFNHTASGSKIVVTTRIENVAAMMSSMPPYHLNLLSDEDCWSILATQAFGYERRISDPMLETIGKEIVKKCQGFPLAAKVLGSLLATFQSSVEAWEAILNSKFWEIEDVPYVFNTLPSLYLSYYYLPAHLKPCFSYCSLFPKGYEFDKEQLVLLWRAEGFLRRSRDKTMEEAGDDYFKYLLSRSFFQQSMSGKGYVMHDIVSDLALNVSEGICFTLDHSIPGDMVEKRIRRASAVSKPATSKHFGVIFGAKGLRTFLGFNSGLDDEAWHFLTNEALTDILKSIRVLSLPFYHITALPDNIGNFKHIRYLNFSHSALESLPESICSLLYLQTLILSSCGSLSNLPKGMAWLINLHHLDISGTKVSEMPLHMSRLKSLRTLTDFIVGSSGSKIIELSGLSDLRGALTISKLENVANKEDAVEANLQAMKCLSELKLEWDNVDGLLPPSEPKLELDIDLNTVRNESNDPNLLELHLPLSKLKLKWDSDLHYGRNDPKVLEGLVPPSELKKLTVCSYLGSSFPSWFDDSTLLNLVFLHLKDCLNCRNLPSIGKLPLLEDLQIEGFHAVKSVGLDFYGQNLASDKPFRSLKKLRFAKMIGWEEWGSFKEDEGNEFPCLHELHLEDCPKLAIKTPIRFPCLKKLVISHECKLLVDSLPLPGTPPLCDVWIDNKKAEKEALSKPSSSNKSHQADDFFHSTLPHIPEVQPQYYDENVDEGKETVSQDREQQQYTVPRSLKVSNVTLLKKLPKGLYSLRIEGDHICEAFPIEIMTSNPSLQDLYIVDCSSLNSFTVGPFDLNTLHIRNCRKLEFSSEVMHNYLLLEHLCIGSSCDSLRSFPLNFFPKLKTLCLQDCTNLESISMREEIHYLKDLTLLDALEIRDCHNLVFFPKEGLSAPNLTSIIFSNCSKLPSLPCQMRSLTSLQSLYINNCPRLESLPAGGLPASLNLLCIAFCDRIIPRKEWELDTLDALSHFEIEGGCKKIMSFPEKGLLPCNLISLRISDLSNLKLLDQKGFQQLTSLETLEINCCKKLRWLPEELPSSLFLLSITDCQLLKAKLQNKNGKEWSQIADIPNVLIDQEEFH